METSKPTTFEFVAPRHEYRFGNGWCRKVKVGDTEYLVGVERGKMVRIAFKPKGQNRGFHWWGFVRTAKGKEIWGGRVPKTLGCRGLLIDAGIIDQKSKEPAE